MRLLLTTLALAASSAAAAPGGDDPALAHCQTGDASACSRVLLERSCANDYAKSCAVLAAIWRSGRGVPRDLERARALLRRACELGSRDSCRQLEALAASRVGAPEPASAGGAGRALGLLIGVTVLTAAVFLGGLFLRRRR